MAARTPEELMFEVIRTVEELNRVSSRLIGRSPGIFSAVSLELPRLSPAELGFIRASSWLFVHYFEAGKTGVDFLESRLDAYALDASGGHKNHKRLVQAMRTFLQHNLDLRKDHDKDIQELCEAWLHGNCGTKVPGTDDQWRLCLIAFLSGGLGFLQALAQALRLLEADESRIEIIRQWNFRLERYFPPHEFDKIIAIAAGDMGRDGLDPIKLRIRFYDKWAKEMVLLSEGCDLHAEARKLVELALLTGTVPALPISGRDIMQELGIPPGPRVGELLEQARRIFDGKPCTRDELISQLREGGRDAPSEPPAVG